MRRNSDRYYEDLLQIDAVDTRRIDRASRAWVAENVSLIDSIGDEHASRVERLVRAAARTGDVTTLADQLARVGEITENRAALIANDQCLKFHGGLAEARQLDAGITKFEWLNANDEKVRTDHVELGGEVFSWDDLPVIDTRTGERGKPGDAVNCRCQAAAVIDFDRIPLDELL